MCLVVPIDWDDTQKVGRGGGDTVNSVQFAKRKPVLNQCYKFTRHTCKTQLACTMYILHVAHCTVAADVMSKSYTAFVTSTFGRAK